MGLDGGTYITRSDVLRGQSWELSQADDSRSTRGGNISASHVHKKRKLDAKTEKATKWTTCTLSGEPLTAPVVADYLGALYNKPAVLEFLLARAGVFNEEVDVHRYLNQLRAAGGAFDHITSSRDAFEVHLARQRPAPPEAEGQQELYRCPITDLPCDHYPFVALASCGHVFSERAQREMKDGMCSLCSRPFRQDQVIFINGTPEQIEQLKEVLPTRKKGSKKRKAAKEESAPASKHEVTAGGQQ